MKNIGFLIIFLVLFPILAEAASLKDLLNNPEVFDQKPVEVIGEVIGDQLKTSDGIWFNILSEGYNLGVFSQSRRVLRDITYWGSYSEIGDRVKVSGIFYKDCPLHHSADIHLASLEIIKPGRKNKPKVSARKVGYANLSLIICFLVAAGFFLKEKYGSGAK